MKLSTKSRYGARILIELARHLNEPPLQTGKISEKQGIPVKYLEQLITVLRKAELIQSFRGPKGGHQLSAEPSSITLGQVVRLFEGQTDLVKCITAPEKCSMSDECKLRLAWRDATVALYEKLDTITIESLVGDKTPEGEGSETCPSLKDTGNSFESP